ncbi:MAG: sulfite exporter TauE/SafE family protein, partial [Bacteroidota bacterium]|nr:sulfite exporter TauE/SafE family protein [Bacteroidota bacterium]
FFIMFLTGFIAQMVDGSLGMGYGTISTTFLLANGVNPAIVSSRVHSARVFSSGVSGYSHHRFGNINKKLFKSLVLPGILGAVIGAGLAYFSQRFAFYIKIPLCLYTVYLGFFIMKKAFKKGRPEGRIKRAGWLAMAGGFMDSFAGGGWGTLVTSTLISKRKSPRYVIGSVCLAEFFVVLCSSITFFILLKSLPLLEISGLILGGLLAAPIAARLVGKVPVKKMFIAIGLLVILTSLVTLWNTVSHLPHF